MFKEDVMADNEVVFRQQNAAGFDIHIKLVDGRELQVLNKGKKSEQSYSVDILSLRDKSKKVTSVAWKWFASSLLFFTVMLILLKVLPNYLTEDKNLYLGIVLLVGIAGSVFSLIKFWKNTSQNQIFYSRNAHVPIITLRAGKPSNKTFTAFIEQIEERVKKFRNHMDIAQDKQLTGEMKMLRRLSDDGIISNKDYEQAKKKLFSGFDSSFVNRDA